jgi:hypothetical protein
MPIIFDTRGKRTIMDIGRLISRTRDLMKNKYPELLPHFKVIIAHFAQGNVGDFDVYNTIVQPNTYGDLSMLHGEGAKNFFIDFQKWFKQRDKINVDGRNWSEYLLFATDYPYFGEIHAQKVLINLFNKQFFENGGTFTDIKNILGLNQIKILPEYNHKKVKSQANRNKGFIISNFSKNVERNTYEMILFGLAELLSNDKIDITDIYTRFNSSWEKLDDSVYLTLRDTNQGNDFPILIFNIVDNHITSFSFLPNNFERNLFGYKYFNIEDNQDLKALLNKSFLISEEGHVSDTLKHFFNV